MANWGVISPLELYNPVLKNWFRGPTLSTCFFFLVQQKHACTSSVVPSVQRRVFYQVDITKLDFAAPMVSILGPKELLVNRTSGRANRRAQKKVMDGRWKRRKNNWEKLVVNRADSSRTTYMEKKCCCCCLFIFMNLPLTVAKRKWYTMSICFPGDVGFLTTHLNQNRKKCSVHACYIAFR